MIKFLLIINILLGACGLGAIIYNIFKTHILTHNHINHLSADVKNIFVELDKIDKFQVEQGKAIAGIQSTCMERGKQIEKLT